MRRISDNLPFQREREEFERRLPLLSYLFVVVALIVLALTPAVLIERVSIVGREFTTTLLPTYDRLRELALIMERQSNAVSGYLLSGEERYAAALQDARHAETVALQELQPLVERLSPASQRNLAELRRLADRRYEVSRSLAEAEDGPALYLERRVATEALRDSMVARLASIDRDLRSISERRMAEEARGAALQRRISFFLGTLALLAALLVGWFAWQQRRLTRVLQRSLDESNVLRAEADHRRDELERITDSRARLMRGFSHDVKNPLGAADGYLQLLADGVMGPLSEPQNRAVVRANRSIGAAIHLVEDLLELARAETGKLEVAPIPTDVRAVLEDATDEYRAQAEAKGLRISMQVPEVPCVLVTDGARVRQVLGNLVSNAVKYTQEGEVTVRLQPAGAGGAGGDPQRHLAIQVSDTGPGIPGEQQHLLFEEFVRLDPAAARGAGVGLTISHRIAQLLGGEITVESEVGRGSTFTLWLPESPERTR